MDVRQVGRRAGGKPDSCAEKLTVPPPVTAPVAASRGTLKVMVAVPRALASALVTGGTSLAALSGAVNTIGPVLLDGRGRAVAAARGGHHQCDSNCCEAFHAALLLRVILSSGPGRQSLLLLEPPNHVEPEVDVVRAAAARELAESRAERVGDIQLHGVAGRLLLDGHRPRAAPRVVARTRGEYSAATNAVGRNWIRAPNPMNVVPSWSECSSRVAVLAGQIVIVPGQRVRRLGVRDERRRGVEIRTSVRLAATSSRRLPADSSGGSSKAPRSTPASEMPSGKSPSCRRTS